MVPETDNSRKYVDLAAGRDLRTYSDRVKCLQSGKDDGSKFPRSSRLVEKEQLSNLLHFRIAERVVNHFVHCHKQN